MPKPRAEPSPFVYDLIIVGRGTSTAVYLNTLRTGYQTEREPDPEITILAIGKDDPWAGARGYSPEHYTKNINQAEQLVSHNRGPWASVSQRPVDRSDWAGGNAEIIDQMTSHEHVDAEVMMIRPNPAGAGNYLIETRGAGNLTYAANKVVIASGAGIEESEREYHQVPLEVAGFAGSDHIRQNNIMDLDRFQNTGGPWTVGNQQAVAIMGPNAGTDAIMQAATYRYNIGNVFWLIAGNRPPGTDLTWDPRSQGIETSFTADEAKKAKSAGGCVIGYPEQRNVAGFTLEAGTARAIRVVTPALRFEVDYFVYAMGQFGGGIKRAEIGANGAVDQIPFLDRSFADNLEPIYDVSQRFAGLGEDGSGGAWQHVVGLQLKDAGAKNGIEIIGSAASQAGRDVPHNYLDREYLSLQDDLRPFFHNRAHGRFPELAKPTVFSRIYEEFDLANRDDDYFNERIRAYRRDLETDLRPHLARVLGNDREGAAAVESALEVSMKKIGYYIYLFELRLKAARFLRGKHPGRMVSAGLARTLPATAGDQRLIGGIQKNVAAVNEFHNVEHIERRGGINYLEDQQTIAVYIAEHFPHIPPDVANGFVREIIEQRRQRLRGFDAMEILAWDQTLTDADEAAKPRDPANQLRSATARMLVPFRT